MSYHVDHKFPKHAVEIEALSYKNKDFEALLAKEAALP